MTITLGNANAKFCYNKLKDYFFETSKDNKFDYTTGVSSNTETLAEDMTITDINMVDTDGTTSIRITGKVEDNPDDINIDIPSNSKIFFNNRKINITNGTPKNGTKISLIRNTITENHRWYESSMKDD